MAIIKAHPEVRSFLPPSTTHQLVSVKE
jgi:hypothetical protein